MLNGSILKYLQEMSKKVAKQKTLIVPITWHNFFDNVLQDINGHEELQEVLYDTEAEFLEEDVPYRSISATTVRSNMVKKYLHQILTNVIFNYVPCKDPMQFMEGKHKPSSEKWADIPKKWLSLSAEPFPNVSQAVSLYVTLCIYN